MRQLQALGELPIPTFPKELVQKYYHDSEFGAEFRRFHDEMLDSFPEMNGDTTGTKRSAEHGPGPTPLAIGAKKLKLANGQAKEMSELPTGTRVAEAGGPEP